MSFDIKTKYIFNEFWSTEQFGKMFSNFKEQFKFRQHIIDKLQTVRSNNLVLFLTPWPLEMEDSLMNRL